MMRTHFGAFLTALSMALLTGCTSEAPTDESTVASPDNAAARALSPADVNTTALEDANYATRPLLEARKAGLAKASSESEDATKIGTVNPHAADPYTRADYPDVVRQWGQLIPTINKERKVAAQIAAREPRCDGVVNAQITDHGSRDNRHYMTECNNLTRVYFDAESLAHNRAAMVRTQADMGAQGVLDW